METFRTFRARLAGVHDAIQSLIAKGKGQSNGPSTVVAAGDASDTEEVEETRI